MTKSTVPVAAVESLAAATGTDALTAWDLLRVAGGPRFEQWREQVRRTGGCSDPIHLVGRTATLDAATGEVIRSYSTLTDAGGRLRVRCGNRRASRCPSCAWTYAGDTFHLIRSGLTGDARKAVPERVRTHPRVFATLTAPSFGPVHNRPDTGRCRCGASHGEDDQVLGTPLDPARYDYAGAVLWNNAAGRLWQRFTIYLRREVGARAGLSQREFPRHARLAFGKVAEFQRRGLVHFHAIVRLDGPDGPGDDPPTWASEALLADAIEAAARRVAVTVPAAGDFPARTLRWGDQVDVRPIAARGAGDQDAELTEHAVAAYVAKYATKAAETTGTVDRRIVELRELDKRPDLPAHTRRMIEACWELDAAYPDRLLAHWSHMLGFRGHFSTKSRRFSTTLGALRKARATWRARQERRERGLPEDEPAEGSTLVLAHWTYAGHGHTPGESWLAASIARDLQLNRETAREALADLTDEEEW